jgi:hypothetical protein
MVSGDKEKASGAMRELVTQLLVGTADGKVDANFAQQSLQLIGAVVAENGLTLQPPQPPSDESDEGGGKGKGKGKGRGKD